LPQKLRQDIDAFLSAHGGVHIETHGLPSKRGGGGRGGGREGKEGRREVRDYYHLALGPWSLQIFFFGS